MLTFILAVVRNYRVYKVQEKVWEVSFKNSLSAIFGEGGGRLWSVEYGDFAPSPWLAVFRIRDTMAYSYSIGCLSLIHSQHLNCEHLARQ